MAERKKKVKPIPDVECLKYHGTKSKPDIKIFVSHRIDLDAETIDNPLYIPVRCGAVYDKRKGITMLGDDTGDNISEKYNYYGCLTVLYWIYKNINADYYGFYTSNNCLPLDKTKFDFDIAYSKQVNDKEYIWNHFILNYDANILNETLDIIKTHFPKYYKFSKDYILKNIFVKDNCILMRKDKFIECNEFVFDVLDELFKLKKSSPYSSKYLDLVYEEIGFLLIAIFNSYQEKEASVQILPSYIYSPLKPKEEIKPFFANSNVIVFSCSDYFAPYLAITLKSAIENSSKKEKYEYIVLEKDISEKNKNKIKNLVNGRKNSVLRFINVKDYVSNAHFYLPSNNKDLSEETYYTLLVPYVLENYDKALVLDCDLLIKRDLSELFKTDIKNYYFAAAKEYLFQSFLNSPTINYNNNVGDYVNKKLKIKNEYDYYQAGVLLMNLKKIRKDFTLEQLFKDLEENEYNIVEQDILNKLCNKKIFELDYEWNWMACYSDEVISLLKYIPNKEEERYKKALNENRIGIYHYITQAKPWKYPELKYADLWWNCARASEYYELFMQRLATINKPSQTTQYLESITPQINQLLIKNGLLPRPQSRARDIADKLLPKGSKRREFIKMLCPKDSIQWKFFKKIYRMFDKK